MLVDTVTGRELYRNRPFASCLELTFADGVLLQCYPMGPRGVPSFRARFIDLLNHRTVHSQQMSTDFRNM